MKDTLIKISVLFLFYFMGSAALAQEVHSREEGLISLGMRSTLSAFGDNGQGYGYGGQFRLKLAKRLNTEWFADYITTDLSAIGKRTDSHIGWSVLFYPLNDFADVGTKIPYILAGHCFDYTRVSTRNDMFPSQARWSSAVHAGLGMHYNFTTFADISFTSQYMMHLGKDISASKAETPTGEKYLVIVKEKASLEGHILFTISVNVVIADLWNR